MSSRSLRRIIVAAGSVPLLALAVSAPSFGTSSRPVPSVDHSSFTATPLTPTGTIQGGKAASSTLAETPHDLLKRTDSTPVNVMIKYDYDATASYSGGVDRLAATSPRTTGHKLTGTSAAERAYTAHLGVEERAISAGVRAAAPTTTIGRSYRTVYGGVQATVPANKVKDIVKVKGVVAVQPDTLNQPLTDASSDFIRATPVQQALGGASTAGKGLIYANIDYGVWPEHPSFADQGNLAAPPGPARVCDFGDNPLTPQVDPFVCQHKLIGGRAFLETYLSDPALAKAEPFRTARDSNGHGTHTASTTAGNVLTSAKLLGIDRGPIRGIAPGAWVMEYKVCGMQGCYASDAALAVQQAINDGADVINYSISGGTDPYTDPVEIAFLDAYAANVFVATSAGNDGPGASTVNHLSPWVTTVAATTQAREFRSRLTLRAGNGATFSAEGDSLTEGAGPLPIVLAGAAPYRNARCDQPAAAGSLAGKIVACERGGNPRIQKGLNVKAGGAAGMVLYNPTFSDTVAESHWLPTVHLADGTAMRAFLRSHRGVVATFTAGTKQSGRGDVMAPFSSRGPSGVVIKPDLTAPGVLILAGQTPVAGGPDQGPPGEYFQTISGTSMASPQVAGAALLVRATHPSWTPGQIKSALMTSSLTTVLKQDAKTPADTFDMGSGRVDVAGAAAVPLTLDESADNFFAKGRSALTAVDLNLASISATTMPGALTTTRTVRNVSSRTQQFTVSATIRKDSRITVSPSRFTLRPGHSQRLTVKLSSTSPLGSQRFGTITITPTHRGAAPQHLPVAFVHTQGDVTLTQTCTPDTVKQLRVSTCAVTAANQSAASQTVSLKTTAKGLLAVGAEGATLHQPHGASARAVLAGSKPGVPSVSPGASPGGYLPLSLFGVRATPIGDEQMLTYAVPAFHYNGKTYTSVGVNSNGYLVAGGVTAADTVCCDLPDGPSSAAPNNVLAPFWTDLDGTGAPGVFVSILTSGSQRWFVVEHQVFVAGTTSPRIFQTWIGLGATQDISFAYDPARLPAAPHGKPFLVGAENDLGQGAMRAVAPTTDLVVTSTALTPAESFSYSVYVLGEAPGTGLVTTEMRAPTLPGTTIVTSKVKVTRR